ncbi:MAG: type I methionyl aminopeptidase [Clostridia bacterium]
MITIKNQEQIEMMRRAGRLLYQVLQQVKLAVKPGVSTLALDALAERLIRDAGAIPSFLGYGGFPASLCTSVNEIVVHGIPNQELLQEGDIIGLDCGLILDGWQADSALTVGVGAIAPAAQRLIDVTEACFWQGIAQAHVGNRISDIGHAVQAHAEANGYQPIRALCGHGIGREMHEDPEVLNYGTPGHGLRLRPGMTLAVEPMIAMGGSAVDMQGWHVATADKSLCAHYEHTIVITTGGAPEVLTLPDGASEEAQP